MDDWFLTEAERGNAATSIDRRHGDGCAWTTGNEVVVHVDGSDYFRRLEAVLSDLGGGDDVWFTDWEGHADEELVPGGADLASSLMGLVDRGAALRGLLWRSHPRQAHFAEQDNMHLARELNASGGLLVLDERVRRGGSHHQKMVLVQRAAAPDEAGMPATTRADVGFVGGIDLCHGRRDDRNHHGDPQAVELDERYGSHPPWHDVQLEITGPAMEDLLWSFRERWCDPAPLDHRNPLRALLRAFMRQPRSLPALPALPAVSNGHLPTAEGPHDVQVLRTYPRRRRRYDFAPEGERSIARAYLKAIGRARRLVAIEDQYLWSKDAAVALAEALRAHRELLVVIVVPRYPDRNGRLSGAANQYARNRVLDILQTAGGDRVAVYDLENEDGSPIYVHAKLCVIDDVWIEIGSDNLNRRSWTHDSEIGCAILDERRDTRPPVDPGGHGDGARILARNTRLSIWTEHLGRAPGHDDDLVDPQSGFDALRLSARALDEWARSDRAGERPRGHLRVHANKSVPGWLRPLAAGTYRTVLDPDGRPRTLRRAGTY